MCILWDRKYIVFLSDNKQNRYMSSYKKKKKIVVDAFGLVLVVTSLSDVFPFILDTATSRWFWGSFAFFPFVYIVWAGCSCSSQLLNPHQSCSPGCARAGSSCPGPSKGNSWVKGWTGLNADFNFFHQIHWYSTMRRVWRLHKLHWEVNSLLDCKIKHFCYIFLFWALPWVVYILPLHRKGLFNGARLNCGPGFTCLFFTDSLPNLDNWVLLELSEMPAKALCVQAPAYLDKSELWFLWLIYICTIRIKVLSCPRI